MTTSPAQFKPRSNTISEGSVFHVRGRFQFSPKKGEKKIFLHIFKEAAHEEGEGKIGSECGRANLKTAADGFSFNLIMFLYELGVILFLLYEGTYSFSDPSPYSIITIYFRVNVANGSAGTIRDWYLPGKEQRSTCWKLHYSKSLYL
ncbi:hypothetical protein AVEN_214107-1 [Araneus ventricosus]|uniref:Uncharacterized protein n=1 Tax=Araneus ventricosus TaxID=182803 RepID=A0A4Y2C6M2_ARAVE|nr:hypothetical protein AVEN_214107-1 [Araneus ventricosus]